MNTPEETTSELDLANPLLTAPEPAQEATDGDGDGPDDEEEDDDLDDDNEDDDDEDENEAEGADQSRLAL